MTQRVKVVVLGDWKGPLQSEVKLTGVLGQCGRTTHLIAVKLQ